MNNLRDKEEGRHLIGGEGEFLLVIYFEVRTITRHMWAPDQLDVHVNLESIAHIENCLVSLDAMRRSWRSADTPPPSSGHPIQRA